MFDMSFFLYLFTLISGFILLVKGSDYFVDGSSGFAYRMGIPQLVVGLTIVAMGTSTPEAAVSITAAFKENADITIGNIVGSNILNILIILGITSVITSVAVQASTIRYEIPFMIFSTFLLLVLGLDGTISRLDGLFLSAMFIFYLIYLFISAKKNKTEETVFAEKSILKLTLYIVLGMAAIILGSKLAVYGATEIAKLFRISERFIGLTIVALGTSLPELFTSVTAARKGNADIAIGNIVGSNIFNILFIIGCASLITWVPFEKRFLIDTVIAILSAFLLFICTIPKKRLTRLSGYIMLFFYIGYLIFLLVNE